VRGCASRKRRSETLERLATAAGLDVQLSQVGDTDPTSAIEDALAVYPATEILICRRPHRLDHPLSLVRRVRRATRLTVRHAAIRARAVDRERGRWRVLRDGGHCASDVAQAA
jgi:hypothetical protein